MRRKRKTVDFYFSGRGKGAGGEGKGIKGGPPSFCRVLVKRKTELPAQEAGIKRYLTFARAIYSRMI